MAQTFVSYPSYLAGTGTRMGGVVKLSPCVCSTRYSSLSFSPLSIFRYRGAPETALRRPTFPRIYAFSSNDIKVGSNVEVDGAPWKVIEFLHVKPGKGAAYVRTTMRNYVTGNTVEKTFRAGSKIEEADIFKETKQFTYKDGPQFVFMDLTTYEEYRLNASDVGDKEKWLKEGMDCNLLFWKDKVIDFDLPINVKLKVVEVDPGLKGDTAQEAIWFQFRHKITGVKAGPEPKKVAHALFSGSGGSKPATLETGAIVNVPLFVEKGQEIVVDTRSGQYMSRV